MTLTLAGVVVMADTIFLRAAAVVDLVQQMGFGQGGQRAEEGGTVYSGQGIHQVLQVEGIVKMMAHVAPNQQPHGGNMHAGVVERLLVGDEIPQP